jgi:hypothetical protein
VDHGCMRAQWCGNRVSDLETGYCLLWNPATMASRGGLAMGHLA